MFSLYERIDGFYLNLVVEAKGDIRSHPLLYMDTMMQYYLHVDPDTLSDEQWAIKFLQLEDIRKREQKSE